MVDATDTVSVPLEQVEALLVENEESLRTTLMDSPNLDESQDALAQLVGANAHGQMLQNLREGDIQALDLPQEVATGAADAESTYTATMIAGAQEMELNGIARPEVGSVDETLVAGSFGGNGTVPPSPPWQGGDREYDLHFMSHTIPATANTARHGFIVVTEAGGNPYNADEALLVVRGGPDPDSPELEVSDQGVARRDYLQPNIQAHGEAIRVTGDINDMASDIDHFQDNVNSQFIRYGVNGLNSNTVAGDFWQRYGGDPAATLGKDGPLGDLGGYNLPRYEMQVYGNGRDALNQPLEVQPVPVRDIRTIERDISEVDNPSTDHIASNDLRSEDLQEDANPDAYRDNSEDYDYGIA